MFTHEKLGAYQLANESTDIALLDRRLSARAEAGKRKLKSVANILSTVCANR